MKIAVNGRFLAKPYTGIGQYTRNLYSAMATLYTEDEFVFFVHEKVEVDFPSNCGIVVIKESRIGTGGVKKTYWEQYQVPKAILASGAQVAHFPYPSNPWKKFAIPTVVTVHDAIPWMNKEYNRSLTTKAYQSQVKAASKRADRLITVSNESRKDIAKVTGCPESIIEVVYNAPGEIFYVDKSASEREKVLSKYGIDSKRKYLLYVGGYDERKNVRTLIDVFMNHIAPNFDVDLVLGGGKSLQGKLYESLDYLTHVKKRSSLELLKGNIVGTGFIAESELPALYQSSFAFVSLSEQEGFNLPLIEAAMSKVPIVCSDIAVHREVGGNLPIFVGSKNQNEISSALKKLITDTDYYQKQKQKSLNYDSPYSWIESAKQTYEILNSLI